ncbi:MAG: hypothetical protein WBP81_17475 [Solirubrobacteraceae bacterium]
MPRKTCNTCGAVIYDDPRSPHCANHRKTPLNPGSWSPNRDKGDQAKFRRAILARDGHQCTWIDQVTGVRCPMRSDLRACHLVPLHAGGTHALSNGATLCGVHDRMTDEYAR